MLPLQVPRPAPQLWLVIDKLRQDLPGGRSAMLQKAAKQTLSTLNALRLLLFGFESPSSTADACVSSGRRQLSSYSVSAGMYSHHSTPAWLLSSVAMWHIACSTSRNIIDAQHCLSLTVVLVQVAMMVPTAQPVLFTLRQAFWQGR